MKNIALLVDEIHPLIELIESHLLAAHDIIAKRVYWKDLVYSSRENFGLCAIPLENLDVIYLDRLGEEERSYTVQLMLLSRWAEGRTATIVNEPLAYLAARDKALTAIQLVSKGLPAPDTKIVFSAAQASMETANRQCIVKSTQGVCAEEIIAGIEIPEDQLRPILARDGALVVQPFVNNPDRFIWRVDVVAGRVVMMNRRFAYNNDALPICNGNRGGAIEFENLETADQHPIGRLSIEAVKAFNLDVAGVDIIVDKFGKPYILEINPEPDATYDGGMLRTELPQAIANFLVSKIPHPPVSSQSPDS